MEPARQFTYRFLSLPYYAKINIAQELGLTKDEEDEEMHGIKLFKQFFRRAREQKKLEEMRKIVNERFNKQKNGD